MASFGDHLNLPGGLTEAIKLGRAPIVSTFPALSLQLFWGSSTITIISAPLTPCQKKTVRRVKPRFVPIVHLNGLMGCPRLKPFGERSSLARVGGHPSIHV